jgi:hypothetical protein
MVGMRGGQNPGGAGFGAIPLQRRPGPSGYQHLPLQNGPIPFAHRQGNFKGNGPRGKKNPTKRMSDDARRGSNLSASRHPSFGQGHPSAWQQVRSPDSFHSFPGTQVPTYFPNIQVGAQNWYPDDQRVVTPSYPQAVENPGATPHFHANVRQPQASGQLHSQGRYLRNPYSSMPELNTGQNDGAQILIPSSSRTYAQDHLVVDPHALGKRDTGYQSKSVRQYNPESQTQRAELAPMPNAGQASAQRTTERSREVPEDCKIWIGGLPSSLDQAPIEAVLKQCQGFIRATAAIASKSNPPAAAFCFAE